MTTLRTRPTRSPCRPPRRPPPPGRGASPDDRRRTANAEHVAERPIPRRPGRGTFDPEVAERDRAFKYRRRRRTLLALLLVTAAFVVAAVTVMPSLWIGAGSPGY